MIKTDIIIIGAGPCGLFTVFEAGLLKLKCHLIDSLPQPGGQCSEIYPKKPIYDIPGFPSVLAGELVDNLMEQAAPFKPGFSLGEAATEIDKQDDGTFIVTTAHTGPTPAGTLPNDNTTLFALGQSGLPNQASNTNKLLTTNGTDAEFRGQL
jgi:thioredoxin reductase